MIAAGEHVEPISEKLLRKRRRDAEPSRRILRVGDREMNLFRFDDRFQVPRDQTTACRCENVTDKEEICQSRKSFLSAPIVRGFGSERTGVSPLCAKNQN
jgi:hypothetical protein